MSESQLSEFLRTAGHRPYRELIEYHIARQSTHKLAEAALGEGTMVPWRLRPFVMGYIDAINAKLAYDKTFWQTATCREAFDAIIGVGIEALPLKGTIDSVEAALRAENHELSFQLFQLATVNFAYSASTQRAQRKFMGIRKGLFG